MQVQLFLLYVSDSPALPATLLKSFMLVASMGQPTKWQLIKKYVLNYKLGRESAMLARGWNPKGHLITLRKSKIFRNRKKTPLSPHMTLWMRLSCNEQSVLHEPIKTWKSWVGARKGAFMGHQGTVLIFTVPIICSWSTTVTSSPSWLSLKCSRCLN